MQCCANASRCPNGEGIRIVHMLKDLPGLSNEAKHLKHEKEQTNGTESSEAHYGAGVN
jgi:hypothetical protein